MTFYFEDQLPKEAFYKILEKKYKLIKMIDKIKESDVPESVKLEAIYRDPFSVKNMENPSPELISTALRLEPNTINYFDKFVNEEAYEILTKGV